MLYQINFIKGFRRTKNLVSNNTWFNVNDTLHSARSERIKHYQLNSGGD